MIEPDTETCPDCRVVLPRFDGPVHRYLGASASCWAMYAALGGGEPPIAPGLFNALLVDAYTTQHPGAPSNQAIQSVAVHLLALYGILERGVPIERAIWLRMRPLRDGALRARSQHKHERFTWLTPPSFEASIKVADIVAVPTPQARATRVSDYVRNIWSIWWGTEHAPTIVQWYERYVVQEKI